MIEQEDRTSLLFSYYPEMSAESQSPRKKGAEHCALYSLCCPRFSTMSCDPPHFLFSPSLIDKRLSKMVRARRNSYKCSTILCNPPPCILPDSTRKECDSLCADYTSHSPHPACYLTVREPRESVGVGESNIPSYPTFIECRFV